MRRLLELPAVPRIALKLSLLAVAMPLFWHGLHFSNVFVGILGAAFFFALWLYHGLTSSFGPASAPELPDSNPANGQAIIPGTKGLSSDGSYTGTHR